MLTRRENTLSTRPLAPLLVHRNVFGSVLMRIFCARLLLLLLLLVMPPRGRRSGGLARAILQQRTALEVYGFQPAASAKHGGDRVVRQPLAPSAEQRGEFGGGERKPLERDTMREIEQLEGWAEEHERAQLQAVIQMERPSRAHVSRGARASCSRSD